MSLLIAMQVVRYQQHQIPHNHHLLTSRLEVTPVNGIYGGVSVFDDEALNNLRLRRIIQIRQQQPYRKAG